MPLAVDEGTRDSRQQDNHRAGCARDDVNGVAEYANQFAQSPRDRVRGIRRCRWVAALGVDPISALH